MDYTNKTVLITGASSGIGYELARLFANEKCNLALLARRIELLDEFKLKYQTEACKIITIKCDVSNKEDVQNAYAIVKENFGPVDVAILNSGVSLINSISDSFSKAAHETFGVNFFGLVYFFEVFFKDFKDKKERIIAGVSSLAETRGYSHSGFYSASKAAASLFLESMRIELRKFNVKVITIKPGFVTTPMTAKNRFKMPFLMDVDKAGKIIFEGLKKEKSIIQFPFATSIASKLLRFIPNSVFDSLIRKKLGS